MLLINLQLSPIGNVILLTCFPDKMNCFLFQFWKFDFWIFSLQTIIECEEPTLNVHVQGSEMYVFLILDAIEVAWNTNTLGDFYLIDWLIDWIRFNMLYGFCWAWIVCQSVGSMAGQSASRLVGWLDGWLINWLIDWSIDLLIDWLIDWLIHSFIHSFIHSSVDHWVELSAFNMGCKAHACWMPE